MVAATSETVSLVICTFRRQAQVGELLAALDAQVRPPDEVLIVDASPDDRLSEVVNRRGPSADRYAIRYFHVPPEHRGLTRQRNYGIARATGSIVAFLDDDTLPEPEYFDELVACFDRNPAAIGVGGYITNEVEWRRFDRTSPSSLRTFRIGEWERTEDLRWRLRRVLGLAGSLPPGWFPASGHVRPVSFLPPDGSDHEVEFFMGCAAAWRSSVFRDHAYSAFFEGYGLYEDLDFCVQARGEGSLFLCSRARLKHFHSPSGRPSQLRYGIMVVHNGWFVWRRRWPAPAASERLRWWATTVVLTLCRYANAVTGPARWTAFTEALGRTWGMLTLGVGGAFRHRSRS